VCMQTLLADGDGDGDGDGREDLVPYIEFS